MNAVNPFPLIEYYYIVKNILDKREQNGKVEYLVEWNNTWEPEHRVYCPALVEQFEKKKGEEARMAEQTTQKEENVNSKAQHISRIEGALRECEDSSAQTTDRPEDGDEPEKFIDIIFRDGLYYFVMLWKGSNKASLIPVVTGNILYPTLVQKYLAAHDSD